MYCVGCSSQNPDAGVFCFNCGKELIASPTAAVAAQQATQVTSAIPMHPAVTSQSPEPPLDFAVDAIRNEYPNLNGVGGWLLWFCFITTIVSPAIVVISSLSHPSGYSLIDICLAIFSVFTGVNLWKAKPQALRLTKVLLAIQFCIGALLVIGELISSTSDSTSSGSTSDPGGLRMLVGSIIWFLYFKKSKRVAVVYGRNM
ncbi:hypothetical protein [Edaphobacter modestus]|uniref:Uncharacterized protein DUF2569 n=1 Tax=Edaphobacter modestus TaxID=388466 RepID=A0A4Q7XZ47_9BACT|nr:hypothetical protein [Edaphobacter modestus]RZU29071.1 uncharacterized protein DUF2569 [Edaphobacter modestus]